MPEINDSQQRAIDTPGSVLVTAGAGTGKTRTLVERCLARILDPDRPCGLDRFLVVTFTEAAATEMRRRIRERLAREEAARPDDEWLAEQSVLVETAAIGTLHGFCARLIREHFHELALDPDVTVLDEGRAAILRNEVLNTLLERHYAGSAPLDVAFRDLVRTFGAGSDQFVSEWIRRLHEQARVRPDPCPWLERQIAAWNGGGTDTWLSRTLPEFEPWHAEWCAELDRLRPQHVRLAEMHDHFRRPPPLTDLGALAGFLRETAAFGDRGRWPRGETSFRSPVDLLIAEAAGFLAALGEEPPGGVLSADWAQARGPMLALLELTREFLAEYARARREAAVVDFSDLEHLALELLEDDQGRPGPVALALRERFDHVLVDEYQDINAVQDRLLAALSREGAEANRFLVGDLKQSIYGFRLADPRLFRDHLTRAATTGNGTIIPLQANYRSHPAILEFVNEVFATLMRPELGGVAFDEAARLRPGNPDQAWPDAGAPVEVLLCSKAGEEAQSPNPGENEPAGATAEDRTTTEIEAAAIAGRLQELHANRTPVLDETGEIRPVRWSDMVILLRSPGGRAEAYAKIFEQAGVPLSATRTGLFQAIECLDLLNLLRLLDNPLQDLPLLAVLRSPLVGMDVNELATVRLPQRSGDYWTALARFARVGPPPLSPTAAPTGTGGETGDPVAGAPAAWAAVKALRFVERHARWRELARQTSLSECLETVLTETHYEDWLQTQPRGTQRRANLRRLLDLARDFDRFQRQSVHRFLRFVEAQQEAEFDPEPAAAEGTDAVRLMSIHRSKGLEFPVVVVANLAGQFNETDLRQPLLLDDTLGLCPSVSLEPPPRRHPTLPLLLARRRQAGVLRGEELRLLYVALTRASQKLILTGSPAKLEPSTEGGGSPALSLRQLSEARRPLDWLMPLWQAWAEAPNWLETSRGSCARFDWRVLAGGAEMNAAAVPQEESVGAGVTALASPTE
ncbi:MAG: UvrD-helicase domain-containing protein, partial [Verrucomicrobiae bacterium]|nr:UvrD-helicase domain-containing protein [Verrucomicrobiae bacterium]